MNFLAHIYLSGDNDEIKFGNFIGDWVKGKQYNNFPENIKKGILLHRQIDTFTDKNPVFLKSTKKLRIVYGKHAGILCDILYDHFLAKNWEQYSEQPLKEYAKEFYSILEKYYKFIPERGKKFVPFFIKRNRLFCYADFSCFRKVIFLMSKYTSLPNKTREGIKLIKNNYEELYKEFELFFKEIKNKIVFSK